MTSNSNLPRNTTVYVDGYNLYYGRLRGTAFKWLDLVKLFDGVLAQRDQNEVLTRLHLLPHPLSPLSPATEMLRSRRKAHTTVH